MYCGTFWIYTSLCDDDLCMLDFHNSTVSILPIRLQSFLKLKLGFADVPRQPCSSSVTAAIFAPSTAQRSPAALDAAAANRVRHSPSCCVSLRHPCLGPSRPRPGAAIVQR